MCACNHCWKLARVLLVFFLVVAIPCQAQDAAGTAREIESVKSRIRDFQTRIRSAQNDVEKMLLELRGYEAAAVEVSAALRRIDADLSARQARLTTMNGELEQLDASLLLQKELLAEQVRAMHRTGGAGYLRLLLNQQDPALFGRTLAYHDYYGRVRAERITTISRAQQQVLALQETIEAETQELVSLRSGKQAKLAELARHRKDREQLLARSRGFINDQDQQLQVLLNTERELEALLKRLDRNEEAPGPQAPFARLKGQLLWPVRGKIVTRYGELKKGGKLKSSGVTIAATTGAEVRAVSSGTVVYADWFRNLGLLLILDHGDGYMSLYGHNEELLKQIGDRVGRNSAIARSGDTGGRRSPGLYFEIRKGGNPLNPSLWCRS